MNRNLNKKTISISNHTASFRPFAWLALAILAVGAFGNSVQAQQWLSENFNTLGAGVNLTVGGNCVAVGTAGYATGVTGGGALRILKTTTVASSGTEARWSLSDGSYSTPRPSGYITFKIQQTPGVTSSGGSYMTFRLGANDGNSMSGQASSWFEVRFLNQPYTTAAIGSANANVMTYPGGNAGTAKINQVSINNGSSPVKIEFWYNSSGSTMNYTSPATGGTVGLLNNSFVMYAGNVLVTPSATGSTMATAVTTTGTTPASTIGKIGFVTGSSQPSDFIIDDIYVDASAPSGANMTISSPSTATAQAGYPFSYQIGTSGGAATSYSASPLPSYLSLNTTSGLISGTVPIDAATVALSAISLSATGVSTATGSLTLTITAPPAAAPAITSSATASGFLTKAFTYQIATSTTSPSSTPISYAIATGALPAGLNLNTTTGLISGTPTELTPDGGTQITYTATNPFGTSNPQTLTITINPAPVFTWNNTGTAWSSTNSWTNSAVPTAADIAAFGSLGSGTGVTVAGQEIGGIVFNSGANAYTWSGTAITVVSAGGITNNSTATQTFENKVINSGGTPIWSSVSGGGMVFNGGIDLTTSGSTSGRTLNFAGAGNVTVSGVIANGGNGTGASTNAAVTFSSTGVNLLSGNNTYGGVTTIATNSTLKIGSAGALGATNGNTVVSSGGVLDLNGQTISGEPLSLSGSGISTGGALINSGDTDASWSGTVALGNAATYISASAGKKITLSGVVSGDAKGIYKKGTGTLELSGANTFTGVAEVADGTMILSAPNSATSYKVQGYETNVFPALKVSATNAMSSSANVVGSSSVTKTGTLEFTTNGNYTLNQYNQGNISFTNSSGSPTTLTFTNLTNFFSTAAGRTLANKSTDLTITFNGQMDIGGSTNDVCKIEAFGPVVISNSVFNSSTSTRGLEKSDGEGTLTMYGVNNYNGTTTVLKGTLSIPTGGSLTSCGNTIVKGSGTSAGNSANLNLAGAAGVVQVSTNGFVRGGGSITSLEVQDAGAVEVAVGTTWTTGGTIDFAAGSKVLVTGTPTEASYTLVTASGGITGTPALQTPIDGYSLVIEGDSLVLKQTSTSDTTPPVITVVGADPVTVAQGSVYSDAGATTDDGSAVTPNIPDSITSTVGSKTVTYDSVDASGNNATQKTRTVIVTDQTAPLLVLNGANPLSVTWGGVFTDPGASFTDNVDASKTVTSLDTVDTSRVGSTTLTYSAVDAGGNAAVNVTRTVTVTLADGGTTVGADGLSDLMRYALGGTGPSSKVELPTVAVTSTTLTMNALIRIDDLKVSVVGIYGLAPGTWVTGSPITGVPSSSQTGAVAGVTQRQDFSVPRGTDSKKFMYLKATQTP
jgi:autotransporter-associated beta strand protein